MLASFLLIGRMALAGPEPELATTWRPTLQATTVTAADDRRDTFAVILDGDDTLLSPQLGRGDVTGWLPMGGPVGIYANAQGGTYSLRLARDAGVKRGVDGLAGVGAWIDTPVAGGALGEMFHTKAEFQGTESIAGGFAMDDLQVTATVAMVFRRLARGATPAPARVR